MDRERKSVPGDLAAWCDAEAVCLERWSSPNPLFSSGQDRRSSDRAMLESLYGGLRHAVAHNFQNAGRVLVDRTDVRMLFEGYGLALPVRPLDACCRELEYFIREEVFPVWERLHNRTGAEEPVWKVWSERVAHGCFGAEDYLSHAAWLLFFLVPIAGVVPVTAGHQVENLSVPDDLDSVVADAGWWPRRVSWQMGWGQI